MSSRKKKKSVEDDSPKERIHNPADIEPEHTTNKQSIAKERELEEDISEEQDKSILKTVIRSAEPNNWEKPNEDANIKGRIIAKVVPKKNRRRFLMLE